MILECLSLVANNNLKEISVYQYIIPYFYSFLYTFTLQLPNNTDETHSKRKFYTTFKYEYDYVYINPFLHIY